MDTTSLPKDKTQIMVKTLVDLNYSATKIATALGIGRASVYRYAEQPTPEDLRQYETEIKTLIAVKQYEITASILNKLQGCMDEAYFKDLVSAYTALSKNSQENAQITINHDLKDLVKLQISHDKEEYGL